jgi:hypothetical protein
MPSSVNCECGKHITLDENDPATSSICPFCNRPVRVPAQAVRDWAAGVKLVEDNPPEDETSKPASPPPPNFLPEWITAPEVSPPVERFTLPAANPLLEWLTAPDVTRPIESPAPPALNLFPEWMTAPEVQQAASPALPAQDNRSSSTASPGPPPSPPTQPPIPTRPTSHDFGFFPPLPHQVLNGIVLDGDDQTEEPRVPEPDQWIADCIVIPGNTCCHAIAVTPAAIHVDLVGSANVDDVLDQIKRGRPLREVFDRASLTIAFNKVYSFDCNQKDNFLRIFWTDDHGHTQIESIIDCGDAIARMRVMRVLQKNLGELWVRKRTYLRRSANMAITGAAAAVFALLTAFFIFATDAGLARTRLKNLGILELADLIGGPPIAALLSALAAVAFFGWMLFSLSTPPRIVRIRPRSLFPH